MEFLKIYVTVELQNQLVKVAKEVWFEIKIRRVIKAWPLRVDLMVQELGFQIEHFSQ